MRMWMINPKLLCRKHLLGEHGELHKHRSLFVKGHSIAGRLGQIEPRAMERRHNQLAREMVRRGFKHQSPFVQPDLSYLPATDRNGKVSKTESLFLLVDRCQDCKARVEELNG